MTRKSHRPMHVAFVGSAVSLEICEQSPACSVAGNKFQRNLIRSLTANECSVHVISVRPVAMFPKSHVLLAGSSVCALYNGISANLVPFVNLPVVKQISIAIVIFWSLSIWLWANRFQSRVVLVYNLFAPFSLPVLAATWLMGGKPVAVVADMPHGGYTFRGWQGILERLDFYIQTHGIARFAGVVSLTAQVPLDFAPHLPALTLEGGVDVTEAECDDTGTQSEHTSEERTCLFSGALNEVNGIDLLLQSFSHISDPNFQLWIFGRGSLESLVRAAAAKDPRIIYRGAVPNSDVRHFQRRATVLVNPRPTSNTITRYTFPSKLLEYMLSGRPVISTVLPGIPAEYYPYLYLLREETPEALSALIFKICSSNNSTIGQSAREFVLREKDWLHQGRRVYEFISTF